MTSCFSLMFASYHVRRRISISIPLIFCYLQSVLNTGRDSASIAYAQKRCRPIVTISGRDQIQALVAVAGLK